MPSIMSPQLTTKCIKVLADYINVHLTESQFSELMELNPELNEQLIEFNSPTDTMDREDLINALAIKVTGRHWPTYGDRDDGSFLKAFITGCNLLGYTIKE